MEGTDQHGRVGRLLGLQTREVVDLVGLVVGVGEELLQLGYVLPGLPQIKRAEVLVEAVVGEVLSWASSTLSMLK